MIITDQLPETFEIRGDVIEPLSRPKVFQHEHLDFARALFLEQYFGNRLELVDCPCRAEIKGKGEHFNVASMKRKYISTSLNVHMCAQ